MNKKIVTMILSLLFVCGYAHADSSVPDEISSKKQEAPKKLLKDDVFSVSSDDLDPSASIDRFSGNYDRGYSAPEQSYKADNHSFKGPFDHAPDEKPKSSTY